MSYIQRGVSKDQWIQEVGEGSRIARIGTMEELPPIPVLETNTRDKHKKQG